MPLPTSAEITDPNATNAQMKQKLGQLVENVADKKIMSEKFKVLNEQLIDSHWSYSTLASKDTNYIANNGLVGFAFGGKFSRPINHLQTYISIAQNTSKVILKVFSRNSDDLAAIPFYSASDDLQFTIEKSASELDTINGWTLAEFNFNEAVDPLKPVLFMLSTVDSSGNEYQIGFATCSSINSSNDQLSYYKTSQYGWGTFDKAVAFMVGFKQDVNIKSNKTADTIVKTGNKKWVQGADHPSWTVGFPRVSEKFNAVTTEMMLVSGTTDVVCEVIARRNAEVSNWALPLDLATDKLITVNKKPVINEGTQFVKFNLGDFSVPENHFIMLQFKAVNASNVVVNSGIVVHDNPDSVYPIESGIYGINWLPANNSWRIGVTLLQSEPIDIKTEIDTINDILDGVDSSDLNIFKSKLNVSKNGLKVSIDGVFKEFTSQYSISSILTHDAAASGTTTVNSTLKLCESSQYWVSNPNAWLGYHWLSNVTVKRTDTNATLTLGVDYSVDYFGGKLYSPVLDNIPVSVTFDYKKERYDLIQYNFLTRSISIVKGTERIHDAQEYMPNFAVGNKPLFSVLVVGNEIKGLQPLYKTNGFGGSFYNEPTEYTAIRTHNNKCLRKTFKKLADGSAIKLVGYGDSITAISGGNDTTSPNGNRDLLAYPMTNLPRETVELYSEITTDSFGEHVKIGWNWYLKSLFESKFGSAVTYLNYGLSGFNSVQAASSEYLDNVVASSPDLAVICLGMNDLTDTRLYSNLITIANALKNVGSEVVIMPVPRTPLFDKPQFNGSNSMMGSADSYDLNVARCYQAALDSGSAFVPAHLYFGYDQDNSIGLYHMHYCSSNLVNHPGLYELKIYGKILCSLFE